MFRVSRCLNLMLELRTELVVCVHLKNVHDYNAVMSCIYRANNRAGKQMSMVRSFLEKACVEASTSIKLRLVCILQ